MYSIDEVRMTDPEIAAAIEKEIKRHLDLDTRMSELNNMILAEYDKTLSSYIQMNPDLNLTIEEVKKIIDLQTDVDVNYRYLKVS